MTTPPGWYGKLPVLGDFAARRLPPGFVAAWDGWLQRGMAHAKRHLGSRWLDAFLTAPAWHFVIGREAVDNALRAGVMLPSVDRVGRYFPLTVCTEIASFGSPDAVVTLERWLVRLEAVARTGLDADSSVDAFESALAACGGPEPCPVAAPGAAAITSVFARRSAFEHFTAGSDKTLAPLLTQTGAHLTEQSMNGQTLWWCYNAADVPSGYISTGMPDAHSFTEMLQYTPPSL